MDETRSLIQRAIDEDLLASDDLLAPRAPVAPPGYRLLGLLGRGGCGEVHLAHDERLQRPVAIKFLSGEGAAHLERFRREARFAARVRNARIVQVHEMGEFEGCPFIVMQYLDGGNLAGSSLDVRGVVRVLREVAAALRHAHAEGIVHRDIKPENILLDGDGNPYLTDFGIAHDLRGTIGATITAVGQVMGTPGLMPPEQARGDIEAVDARSDVYALGATMFRTLTGRYPFEGALIDVLHAVIHDEPPLMRSFNAALPRALETFVHRCLSKSREARYQTMQEVVAALDAWLQAGDVPGAEAPWFRRLVIAERRDQGEAAPEPAPAAEPVDPDWTIGTEIVRQIAAWDAELYRASGSLGRAFARLDALGERLDEILARRPDVAWARFYRGVVLARRDRLDEAREEMERSIDRMPDLAGAYFELGRLHLRLHLRGQERARRHRSREGVAHDLLAVRSHLEEAAVAFEQARALRGDGHSWHADYAEAVGRLAENDFDGCVARCDRALETEPDTEQLWKLRGDAVRLAGGDPVPSYERAIEIRRSDYEALHALGEAHVDRGDLAAARAVLERACAIHDGFAKARVLLARIALEEGRAAGSGAALEEGRALAREALRLDAGCYDAAVTLAELEIEGGRADGDPAHYDAALTVLADARSMLGCQNRVHHLITIAELELAQRAGAVDEMRRLLDRCSAHEDMAIDHREWTELRERIEDALAHASP